MQYVLVVLRARCGRFHRQYAGRCAAAIDTWKRCKQQRAELWQWRCGGSLWRASRGRRGAGCREAEWSGWCALCVIWPARLESGASLRPALPTGRAEDAAAQEMRALRRAQPDGASVLRGVRRAVQHQTEESRS